MTAQEFLIEKYLIKFGEKLVDYIPRIPKETNYYAVLVEPRLNHKILYILKNKQFATNKLTLFCFFKLFYNIYYSVL